MVLRRLGKEDPRERDVLELLEVAEVVPGGQATLAGPICRLAQTSCRDPQPYLSCGDRSDIRGVVADVEAGSLVEQIEGTAQISLGLPDSSGDDARPVRVLRKAEVVAEVAAALQVLPCAIEIVPLAQDLAHAHVHVGGAAQHGRAIPAPGVAGLARTCPWPRGAAPA